MARGLNDAGYEGRWGGAVDGTRENGPQPSTSTAGEGGEEGLIQMMTQHGRCVAQIKNSKTHAKKVYIGV